ncbi:MAG: serine protease [Thermoleophilaceae bacterium]
MGTRIDVKARIVAVLVAGLASLALAAPAAAWAPASSATIHPGVQTFTDGAQCTANFVFSDGGSVYLGQAAHCSGTGAATDTNGCTAQSLPVGTKVDIGGSQPGTMVYNSWITMQQLGEKDPDTCQYNDLALVQVDPADVAKVNPSIPFWGGPTGVTDTVPAAAKVLSYGNSELRLGITQLSPKQGIQLSQDHGGWNHAVYTATPGIPGDSGSGFIDAQGRAFGVLSTLEAAPKPAANNVGDVSRELGYLHAHTAFGAVNLVNGTEPFRGPLL